MPATATKRRRPATPQIADLKPLVESYTLARAPLKIDKDAGVIYGVKLGGLESHNTHGIPGVTKGTKYQPQAYKGALPLYEGLKVFPRHLARPGQKESDRGPFDYIGVIRDARWDSASNCPRGDFHYVKSHPNAPQLLEDVERGMGGFGFSHHVPPGGFRGKVEGGWLIVNEIREIKSVDLVNDPATTRNLWESQEQTVNTTFKAILEEWAKDKSAARQAVATALLEDDAPAAMDAPVAAPEPEDAASQDPDDLLWAGFTAAIIAIINGDGSAADKAKQVGKYLKAHEKLTAAPEPKADDAGGDDDAEPKESKETHELKARIACLEAGMKNPSPALLEALTHASTDANRKALIEEFKKVQTPAPTRRPTSSAPGRPTNGPPANGGKVPTGDAFRRSIRD